MEGGAPGRETGGVGGGQAWGAASRIQVLAAADDYESTWPYRRKAKGSRGKARWSALRGEETRA
ncbi:hypothetical protein [Streptomyces sp. HUAS ZL42]|uniref:hypothetical protein n=1 Tax=Streptomyces sp. HUAS ZL42 TaxID=3231715 RepID=UPI00345F0CD8